MTALIHDTPTNDDAPSALDLIRGWKWFAHVPEADRAWFAAQGTVGKLRPGAMLYEAGAPVKNIYVVRDGTLRVFLASPRGDEITMEEVVRGGWVPHVTQAAEPKHLIHCDCPQGASVIAFPNRAFRQLGERAPGLYRGLYEEFTDRGTMITARIELLALHNLEVRLAVYLMRIGRLRGERRGDGSIWVPLTTSQTEIGARVAGTRQNVNTILKSWDKRGVVKSGKGGLLISDGQWLSAKARKSGFDLEAYLSSWHGGWQGSACQQRA